MKLITPPAFQALRASLERTDTQHFGEITPEESKGLKGIRSDLRQLMVLCDKATNNGYELSAGQKYFVYSRSEKLLGLPTHQRVVGPHLKERVRDLMALIDHELEDAAYQMQLKIDAVDGDLLGGPSVSRDDYQNARTELAADSSFRKQQSEFAKLRHEFYPSQSQGRAGAMSPPSASGVRVDSPRRTTASTEPSIEELVKTSTFYGALVSSATSAGAAAQLVDEFRAHVVSATNATGMASPSERADSRNWLQANLGFSNALMIRAHSKRATEILLAATQDDQHLADARQILEVLASALGRTGP